MRRDQLGERGLACGRCLEKRAGRQRDERTAHAHDGGSLLHQALAVPGKAHQRMRLAALLLEAGLPAHLVRHVCAMAALNTQGRYDRMTDDVLRLRGASFFGVPGLEAAYLEHAFGSAPLAGFIGSCEIGPVGGQPELLTYTGVLALIDG